MVVQESGDDLVPDLRVLGRSDPVPFGRELQELVGTGSVVIGGQTWLTEQLVPQPQALADGHAIVLVTMDDQHRGADIRHMVVGGELRCAICSVISRTHQYAPSVVWPN